MEGALGTPEEPLVAASAVDLEAVGEVEATMMAPLTMSLVSLSLSLIRIFKMRTSFQESSV